MNNKIFTVGDSTNHGKIQSFEIIDNAMYAKCSRGLFNINELSPETPSTNTSNDKPVLFTTEDGVKIYGGEKLYKVSDDFSIYFCSNASKEDANQRAFSTHELAEQYILENKPCLSLNDLLEVWDKHGITFLLRDYKSSGLYKNFEQKAKEKLNK